MMTSFFNRAGIVGAGKAKWMRSRRRGRRGAYVVLFALVITILLGFGALAIDGSMYRFGVVEAQDVADAAAHAAVLTLKRTGSEADATLAAQTVTAANKIAGLTAEFESIAFGTWDTDAFAFTPGGSPINAVKVEVGRTGEQAVGFGLAPVLGYESADILEPSVAATRALEVVLVMDITVSWEQRNFALAREAAVAFLDVLHQNHGEADMIGMSVFFGPYAWEYTPLTSVEQSANNTALIRDVWSNMNIGSMAGDYNATWASGGYFTTKHVPCNIYATDNEGMIPYAGRCESGDPGCHQPTHEDDHDFSSPVGGCFPNMPRVFWDEGGTDYTTGLEMAKQMLAGSTDPSTYRAVVVLTDGKPDDYSTWTTRDNLGYVETRWNEFESPEPHSIDDIVTLTPILAQELYDELGANVWFVSFRDQDSATYDYFMTASKMGDGYYAYAASATQLEDIFEEIALSLPVAVVE